MPSIIPLATALLFLAGAVNAGGAVKAGIPAFAGLKRFYRLDVNLFHAGEVMGLTPVPSVVIYQ